MADFSGESPSEKLAKMIEASNKRLLEMALDTDKVVNDTIEKHLISGIKKITESFEEEIEKIRSMQILHRHRRRE